MKTYSEAQLIQMLAKKLAENQLKAAKYWWKAEGKASSTLDKKEYFEGEEHIRSYLEDTLSDQLTETANKIYKRLVAQYLKTK